MNFFPKKATFPRTAAFILFASTQLLLPIIITFSSASMHAQGSANVKVYPPTCYNCDNGRIILTELTGCGIPELSHTWLVDSVIIYSPDTLIGLETGYVSLVVHDASAERDTLGFYLWSGDETYELNESWDCFDSTSYRNDIEFTCAMLHADTRDTIAGGEVSVFQDDLFFAKLITPIDDTFSMYLPIGHTYRIAFGNESFYTKTLIIEADEVDPWKVGRGFSIETSVSMIGKQDGIALDILDDPIGICRFSSQSDTFEWDWEYTARIKELIDVKLGESPSTE